MASTSSARRRVCELGRSPHTVSRQNPYTSQQTAGDAGRSARTPRSPAPSASYRYEHAGAAIDTSWAALGIEIQRTSRKRSRNGWSTGRRGSWHNQCEKARDDLHDRAAPLAMMRSSESLPSPDREFLPPRIESVDFVDEKDVTRFEAGEERGKISGFCDHRT